MTAATKTTITAATTSSMTAAATTKVKVHEMPLQMKVAS